MQRSDGRAPDQIRPITFELNIAPHASGSVLVAMGNTRVICGVTIEEIVPRWMKEQGVTGGWLTAEYSMLPYSTQTRKPRDITKGRLDGRSTEIQRLIGRSLRAVVDLPAPELAACGTDVVTFMVTWFIDPTGGVVEPAVAAPGGLAFPMRGARIRG